MSAEHAVVADVLVIIGTGAMGLSVARRMGAGRVIVLADIDDHLLTDVAECLITDGHRVLTKTVDVTLRDSVADLAAFAADAGRVLHVVHTAGLSPSQASAEAILAVALGDIHGQVGVAQQILRRGAVIRILGHTDAHRDAMLLAAEVEGLAQAADQSLGGHHAAAILLTAFQQQ